MRNATFILIGCSVALLACAPIRQERRREAAVTQASEELKISADEFEKSVENLRDTSP